MIGWHLEAFHWCDSFLNLLTFKSKECHYLVVFQKHVHCGGVHFVVFLFCLVGGRYINLICIWWRPPCYSLLIFAGGPYSIVGCGFDSNFLFRMWDLCQFHGFLLILLTKLWMKGLISHFKELFVFQSLEYRHTWDIADLCNKANRAIKS